MDHETTREQLELAAVEPDGLERLMAGDTVTAQAVVAHLAGCPSCTDELVRLERASSLVRQVVREMPPPDLRERTLATVAAVGVARGGRPFATSPAAAMPGAATGASDAAVPPAGAGGRARPGRRRLLVTVATLAAAVVLSVGSTMAVMDSRLGAETEAVAALGDVTMAAMSIAAQPDATAVTLSGVTDPTLDGRLSFSPSTTQLVVVAMGLAEPPAGSEYRCWVEVDGKRERVGRLAFSGGMAWWDGPAPVVADLAPSALFGVSLVAVGASGADAPTILVGHL
jgi:hypothetical protein